MANEFEQLDNDEFPTGNAQQVQNDFTSVSQDQIIDTGKPGMIYDWSKAPDGVKAPPRQDMDGMELVIKKADIIIPPLEREWSKTKKGDKEYKYCTFVIYYDHEGQQEFYSGIRVFKREQNKYSAPTITRDRMNQASDLLGKYADFKQKNINEISMREFMAFLNSQPKAVIHSIETKNPETGVMVKKNFIKNFV